MRELRVRLETVTPLFLEGAGLLTWFCRGGHYGAK